MHTPLSDTQRPDDRIEHSDNHRASGIPAPAVDHDGRRAGAGPRAIDPKRTVHRCIGHRWPHSVGYRHTRLAREHTAAEAAFVSRHPAYATTAVIDALRASEYSRFDAQGHTYLDYTGGGVYAHSQVKAHADLLARSIAGNPHSGNLPSQATTALINRARSRVLEYFRASPDDYEVIFTPNATGALKLVGESYAFAPGSRYLLTADNHNSVNGIREFARRRGADVEYAPIVEPELRLDASALAALLAKPADGPKLFAYPAQSNFSGVRHSLEWVAEARRRGWDVLLDAAAFVPTARLDLSRCQADFVPLSFYKLFGYPTGLGALLARRTALDRLQRPWYAGGTTTLTSVSAAEAEGGGFSLRPGSARFEDGTVNYLSIPAVEIGLDWIASIGIDTIHLRVDLLTGWLLEQLQQVRHANGQPVVCVYGPRDTRDRGATVALNLRDPSGAVWDCWHVEAQANERKLSVRAGCHCNPGAREVALGYPRALLVACFKDKEQLSFEEYVRATRDCRDGVVRVSLGVASTFSDVQRFVAFARSFIDQQAPPDRRAAFTSRLAPLVAANGSQQ
ncbi:MAG: aminotransferase class V-fold PLP-dependent enzyme [Chloroflexi bacterium]|nr:aminotransferase class V-fold PLP-dependent enzyme [Chloroflexota bacterium]